MEVQDFEIVSLLLKKLITVESKLVEVKGQLSESLKLMKRTDKDINRIKEMLLSHGSFLEDELFKLDGVSKVLGIQKPTSDNVTAMNEALKESPVFGKCRKLKSRSEAKKEKSFKKIGTGPVTEHIVSDEIISSKRVHSQVNVTELEKECKRLTQQVSEMEKFLEDYGLTWVGNGKKSVKEFRNANKPDFDKISAVVEQLNVSIGENCITYTSQGAKFRKFDTLRLTLYENGMEINDGHFREYSSPSVNNFFCDLEDGYYPAELKTDYPEGVLFKIIDNRGEKYNPKTKQEVFSGTGYRLGKKDENEFLNKTGI